MVAGLSEATELSSDDDSSTMRRLGLLVVYAVSQLGCTQVAVVTDCSPLLGTKDGRSSIILDLGTGWVGRHVACVLY